MLKSLTTTAMAATLAITSFTATPAQASDESDTIAALIFGAAALWAVIEATDDDDKKNKSSDKDDDAKTHTHSWGERHRHAHAHAGHKHQNHNHNGNKNGHHGNGNDGYGNKTKVLPGQCQRSTRNHNSDPRKLDTYFSTKCLSKKDADNGLPSRCEKTYQTDKGPRSGYATNCLLRNGYVIGHAK